MKFLSNSHTRMLGTWLGVVLFLLGMNEGVIAQDQVTKPHGLNRWAVLATKPVQTSGVSDLILARLTPIPGVQMLERERMAAVADEATLIALMGDARGRREMLKKFTGADALLILTQEEEEKRPLLAITVCDVAQGLNLWRDRLPWEPGASEEALANQVVERVKELRRRYSEGIRWAVGVPLFVSDNLVHDFDALQTSFSHLLESALCDQPGVAVLEIQEAHQIVHEQAVSETRPGLTRVVPCFIEGRFKVNRTAQGDAVDLQVQVTSGQQVLHTVDRKSLPMTEVAGWLSKDLPAELLRFQSLTTYQTLSEKEQFDRLVQRAAQFARLGDWRRSSGLREAALLIRNEGSLHRATCEELTKLVWSANRFGIKPDEAAERRSYWPRAVEHLEKAIRAKAYLASEGIQAARSVLSVHYPRFHSREMPPELDGTRIDFLTRNYFLLLDLTPERNQYGDRQPYPEAAWLSVLVDLSLNRYDQKLPTQREWDLVRDGLNRTKPNVVLPDRLVDMVHVMGIPDPFSGITKARESWANAPEYIRFLESLSASDRPRESVLGRYGLLRRRILLAQAITAQDQAEYSQLRMDCSKLVFDDLIPTDQQRITHTMNMWSQGVPRPPSNRVRPATQPSPQLSIVSQAPQATNGTSPATLPMRRVNITPATRPANANTAPAPSTPYAQSNLLKPAAIAPPANPPAVATTAPSATTPVRFVPVPLSFQLPDQSLVSLPCKSKDYAILNKIGSGRIFEYISPCGPDTDLFWGTYRILVMKKRGVLEELARDLKPRFTSVVWDGRHAWIGTRTDQVLVYDLSTNTLVQTIGADQGLPPCDSKMLLHPLSPGRVIAVGSFGEHQRAWCAVIELGVSTSTVKVFHTARRLPEPRNDRDRPLAADFTFTPEAISEVSSVNGDKRALLVKRRTNLSWAVKHPLLIDLQNLSVRVCESPLDIQANQGFSLPGSVVFWASGGVTQWVLDEEDDWRYMPMHRIYPCGSGTQNPADMRLLRVGGKWYAPGGAWYEITPGSKQERPLMNPPISQAWRYMTYQYSSHFGVLAWKNPSNTLGHSPNEPVPNTEAVYQVSIDDIQDDANAPANSVISP